MILFKRYFGPFGSPSSPGRRLDSACRSKATGGLRGATCLCLRPDGYQPMPDVNGNSPLAASVPDAPLPGSPIHGL
ncbi:hypothetical protein KX16_003681 [Salmonella enterica subsp. enterica]|nr:hypothetical protein [Salmonella enterica subsp. enterica serovar Mikawasima]